MNFYIYSSIKKITHNRINAVRLVGIGDASHARHDTENVVVHGVHTDLSGGSAGNSAR